MSADCKSILFVDNDENVLSGIQRMLRRYRDVWDLHFVTSGEAALELMATQPIAVVVTDLLMTGMHGDELLRRVEQLHPATVRLILSGHVDQQASSRLAHVAHQCLVQPCDAETLLHSIQHVLRARELVQNPRIRAVLGDISSLPALPRVYHELTAAIDSATTDVHTIAAIFARDMALSAKLLQLVNSSFFGLGRRVSSMNEAVMLLGVQCLRALVLNAHLFEALGSAAGNGVLSMEKLWRDAFMSATLARAIAKAERQPADRQDQAYTGGLLHNLGLLLFASRLPAKFRMVMERLDEAGMTVQQLEHELLGATHAEVGAYLLGLWNLPSAITEAVLLQHTPGEVSYDGFCSVTAVHVAVALLAESGEAVDRHFAHPLDMAYLERLALQARVPVWRQLAQQTRMQAAT